MRHIRHKYSEVYIVPTLTSTQNDAPSLSGSEEIEPTQLDELLDEIQEEKRLNTDTEASWPGSNKEILKYQPFEKTY